MTTNEIADVVISSMAERSFKAFLTTYARQGMAEADVFSVNPNGYMYEYEIKRSRSDFLAEFRNKKAKHRNLQNRIATRTYDKWVKGNRTGEKETILTIPNRYYFVCVEGLISAEEVPEYAGLVYVIRDEMHEIKSAPLLHRNKANEQIYESIAGVLSQRVIYGCSYYTYKHQHDEKKTN